MVIIWIRSTHGGCNWTPKTLWTSQNMFQTSTITISQHPDIRIITDFADLICGYHPSIIDIGWCDTFSCVSSIHLKPLVTLVGRGGGGRRVLFDGEVREVRVTIVILYIYREDIWNFKSSVESKAIRPSAWINKMLISEAKIFTELEKIPKMFS